MDSLWNIVTAGLVLLAVTLQKTYTALPVKEIKRRARVGNHAARTIYRVAAYGQSLRALLWLVIIVCSALFFVVVDRTAPLWFALTTSIALLWIAYVWLPNSRITAIGEHIAVWLAPALGWLLNYLHPVINRGIGVVHRGRPLASHTGLYEKEDLLEFMELQEAQVDSRIDKLELQIAASALKFGEQLVRKHLTPRRMIKTVSVSETIGPLLMDELHKSGHSRFPVHDGKKDNIVGTLYMRDLVNARSGGSVKSVMKTDVAYVHEEQNLYDALQAVIKTHHHLLVVVNSFEEYVGIITLEDILEQVVGKVIIDEFDQYNDLRAVAARAAEADRKARHEEKPEKDTPVKEDDGTITPDDTKK